MRNTVRSLRLIIPVAFAILVSASACGGSEEEGGAMKQWSKAPEMTIDVNKVYKFTIETTLGTLTGELRPKDAPVTVNSFVFLAREGYFDGVIVHRILKGFVLQTGDPTGTGSGGPGYRFHDEAVVGDYLKGTLAMANSGPNTNGSQFFVVLDDLRGRLPKDYTIFGQTDDAGFGVLDAIAGVEVMVPAGGSEKSRPVERIVVTRVTIDEQ